MRRLLGLSVFAFGFLLPIVARLGYCQQPAAVTRTLIQTDTDPNSIYRFDVSPTGKLVAAAMWIQDRKLNDYTVHIYDGENGKLKRKLFQFRGMQTSVAFAPKARLMATAGLKDQVRLWDTKTWKIKKELRDRAYKCLFSPDGHLLALQYLGGVSIHKAPDWKAVYRPIEAIHGLTGLAFSRDSKLLAASDSSGKVLIWSLKDRKLLSEIKLGRNKAKTLAFSPDGKSLLVGSEFSFRKHPLLFVFDPNTGKKLSETDLGGNTLAWIDSLAFSPNGKLLAVSGGSNKVWVFSWPSLKSVESMLGFQGLFHLVQFYPDSRTVIAADNNKHLYAWRLGDKVLRKDKENR